MKITIALITTALCYRRCDKEKYPYAGQKVSIPIVPTATQAIMVNNISIPVSVQGTINVIDGCTFQMANFSLSGSFSAVWFGGNGTDVDGYRLSQTGVPASQGPITTPFEFIMNAGSWVSYYDFTQFRLFELNSNALIATADLPPRPTTGSNNSPTGSGSGTDSASEPQKTSSAQRAWLSLYALSLLFI